MGERKGVNKYYPPDFDPQKHQSLDKYHNTHPLRERAKKIHLGILVIRYEMPYNVWCEGCGKHIGMGVRYNAEKKKVGNYYTTPIYQFKMKCHLCDNYLVMETDPKNCEYKCISGVRRKNQKWDMEENEQIVPEDKEELKKRAADAMSNLEHGVNDKKKSSLAMPTLGQLAEAHSGWHDDYQRNAMLRQTFRAERKKIEANSTADAELLSKSSLDIDILAEREEDKELAALMKYNVVKSFDEKQKQKREEIQCKSIFSSLTTKQNKNTEKYSARTENLIDKLESRVLKTVSAITFGAPNKRHQTMSDIGVCKKKMKSVTNKSQACSESLIDKCSINEGENHKTLSKDEHCLKTSTNGPKQTSIVNKQTSVQSMDLVEKVSSSQSQIGRLCEYTSSSDED
ncbi:coiled-coil domain-containing protein 130 homolog [Antedon mediterranea]|uniref:coiled-coil domain-containing protein 130 homolog n=1 Tax=Antedon mediterranea TaxID=105859 RepID=UPI003AF8CA33